MRIKLDENLPAGLAPLLAALGHEVDTVPAEGIGAEDDDVVWRAAQADGRFLVTQDLDFSDARKYAPGTHHGLLRVPVQQPLAGEARKGQLMFNVQLVAALHQSSLDGDDDVARRPRHRAIASRYGCMMRSTRSRLAIFVSASIVNRFARQLSDSASSATSRPTRLRNRKQSTIVRAAL